MLVIKMNVRYCGVSCNLLQQAVVCEGLDFHQGVQLLRSVTSGENASCLMHSIPFEGATLMKNSCVSVFVILSIAFLCFPRQGLANHISIHLTGKVTAISSTSRQYSWETEGYFQLGDPFELYYTYRSDLQPAWSYENGSTSSSTYMLETVDFAIGKVVTGSAANGELTVSDGFQVTADQYVLWADVDNGVAGLGYPHKLFSLGAGLLDSSGKAFDSSDLFLLPPDMSDFDSSYFGLIFGQGASGNSYVDSLRVSGTICAIERIESVPEPAAILLFSTGVLGLLGAKARKRR